MIQNPTPEELAPQGVSPRISVPGIADELKKSVAGNWLGLDGFSGGMAYSDALLDGRLTRPYKQVAWVQACVNEIVKAAKVPPMKFRQSEDRQSAEVTAGPIVELFRQMNGWTSWKRAIDLIVKWSQLDGEILLLLKNAQGRPVNHLNEGPDTLIETPTSIELCRGGQGRVGLEMNSRMTLPLRWLLPSNKLDGDTRIDVGSVAFIHWPDPDEVWRGCGPLAAAMGQASNMYGAERLNGRQIENNGDPGGIVAWDMPADGKMPNADVQERIEERARQNLDIARKQGRTPFLWGGKYIPIGGSSTNGSIDASFQSLAAMAKEDISAVFGVPGAILGREIANYATYQGEKRRFWDSTVAPLLDHIACQINEMLARLKDRRLAENHYAFFDYSGVDAMQDPIEERAAAARSLMSVGVPIRMALEQARIPNVGEIEGADEPLLEGTWKPLSQILNPPAPPPQIAPPGAPGGPGAAREGETPPQQGQDEADDDAPAKALAKNQRGDASQADLADFWHRNERKRELREEKLGVVSRRFFRRYRIAQLAHLRKLAREAPDLTVRSAPVDVLPDDLAAGRAYLASRTARSFESCCGEEIGSWEVRDKGLLDGINWPMLRAKIGELDPSQFETLITPDEEALIQQFALEFSNSMVQVFESASDDSGFELGLQLSPSTVADRIAAIREIGVFLSEGVASTLAQDVRDAIAEILESDPAGSIGDIRSRVLRVLDPLKEAVGEEFDKAARRSTVIARTEGAFADNWARYQHHLELKRQGRAFSHEWVTSQDARVRETHAELHGTFVEIGTPWTLSDGDRLLFPGDKAGKAKNTIHERCAFRVRRLREDVTNRLDGSEDPELEALLREAFSVV
jgi:hypothetical protein